MKHKTLRTLLCVILTVCFCLSAIVPASAAGLFGGDIGAASIFDEWFRSPKDRFTDTQPGTDETTPVEQTATGDNFIRIFHLDCGRKYFSVDDIKKIINWIAENHYTHIELAFGNDGLRLLLDEDTLGSISVGTNTYTAKKINDGIQAGNTTYSNNEKYYPETGELTQTEMSTIISYAKSKNIGVIPLLNSPGHMDAIIDCMESLGMSNVAFSASWYGTSARTIDVANSNATAFTQALITKYVKYFADQGCEYFNLGADEYANDILANYSGMGFGYLTSVGGYDNFVTYINAISKIITDAKMIPMAFNDGIYYNSTTTSGTFEKSIVVAYWTAGGWSGYNVAKASFLAGKGHKIINTNDAWYYVLGRDSGTYGWSANKTSSVKYNDTPSSYTTEDGCMLAVWCDSPSASYNTTEEGRLKTLIENLANNNQEVFAKPVAPTISNAPTSLLVGNTAELTMSDGSAVVWSIDDTSKLAFVDYTDGTSAASVTVRGVASGDATVTAATTDGETATATIRVYEQGEAANTVYVSVAAGGTYPVKHGDGDKRNDTITNENTDNVSAVLAYVPETSGDPIETTLNSLTSKTEFYIKTSSGAYFTSNGGTTTDATKAQKWKYSDYTLSYKDGNTTYYLRYYQSGRYGRTTSRNQAVSVYYQNDTIYNYYDSSIGTPVSITFPTPTPAYTNVTFTGIIAGTTTNVRIGDTLYVVTVTDKAPDNALAATSIDLEYWITNLKVYDGTTTSTNHTQSISSANAASEDGIEIKSFAPGQAYVFLDDGSTAPVYYWQAMRLDTDNKQTEASGDDETADGTTLTHVRYHSGAWQYKTVDGTWHYFMTGDQLVAYYLQKTEVTKEIETYVKDWGYGTSNTTPDTSSGKGQVALTVAVVYPDGSVSPTEANMYSQSTTIFNYWAGRDIGIVAPVNNGDYNIAKITVTDGTRDKNTSADVWYTSDTITWEKKTLDDGTKWYKETEVWNKSSGTTPMVNGKNSNITWSAKNTGKLVLIYLETIEKETNLNVVYWDDNIGQKINTDNKQISMKYTAGDPEPTYFNSLNNTAVPTQDGYFTLDDTAFVTNSSNVNQTFNKKLSTVQNVPDSYKTGLYEYVGAEIQDGGKTLVLHYNINSDKLSKSYVIDFGSPFVILASDFMENVDRISTVEFLQTPKCGAVVARNHYKELLYTPDKPVDAVDTIKVKVYYTDNTHETFTIGIVPATNVYYEETFMTRVDTANTTGDWKHTDGAVTEQEKELGGSKTYVYGYDKNLAVMSSVAPSGGSEYRANLTLADGKKTIYTSDKLTFSFTGTGFDLISDSGKNTGILVVRLDAAKAGTTKTYIIDTYFHGDKNVLNNTNTIYQTPVIRELNLGYDTYTVAIRGALYRSSGAVLQPEVQTASTYSMQASVFADEAFDLRAFLDECGLADVSVEDVELIYMDENSVLNGGTGMSGETQTPVDINAVSTYAMNTTAANEGEFTATVSVDGFRVYNPLEKGSSVYISDKESGIEYNDLRQYVEDHQDSTVPAPANTKQVLYVEYNSEHKVANIADYNTAAVGTNGPKYEIYLAPGCGIAFALDSQDSIDVLQLSAKVVSGTPSLKVGDEEFKVTATNGTRLNGTEMYFDISSCVKESNGQKYVTIINNAAANYEAGKASVLAVNVLKMGSGIEPVAIDDETQNYILAEFAASMAEPVETFNPEVFEVSAPATVRRNRTFSISVNVSVAELEKVTVTTADGVETELNALNKLSVKWGISSEYYYLKTFRMKNSGEYTFKITAYGKDGSSISKNVTVAVK